MTHARKPDVIIVGAGISGCAAAIIASKKGNQVLVITKYASPERPQRVYINGKTFSLLESILHKGPPLDAHDADFLEEIKKNKIASIRKIEFLLFKQAKAMGVQFFDQSQGMIESVNLKKQFLVLSQPHGEDKKVISLGKLLIDASGPARVIFKHCLHDNEEALPYQPLHPFYGTALFNLDIKNQASIENLSFLSRFFKLKKVNQVKFSNDQLKVLKIMGWENNFPPQIYIIPVADLSKIQVIGHIPCYPQERAETVFWFKHMIKIHFNLPQDAGIFVKEDRSEAKDLNKVMKKYGLSERNAGQRQMHKEKLRVTTFQLHLNRLKNFILQGPNKKYADVIAIGEAVQNSFFIEAHGIYDALASAFKLLDCINDDSFDIVAYAKFIKTLIKEQEARVQQAKGTIYSGSFAATRSVPHLTKLEHKSPQLESKLKIRHLTTDIKEFMAAVLDNLHSLTPQIDEAKEANDLKTLMTLFQINGALSKRESDYQFFKSLFFSNKVETVEEMLVNHFKGWNVDLDQWESAILKINQQFRDKILQPADYIGLTLICILHTFYHQDVLKKYLVENQLRTKLNHVLKVVMQAPEIRTFYQKLIPEKWQVLELGDKVSLRTKSS